MEQMHDLNRGTDSASGPEHHQWEQLSVQPGLSGKNRNVTHGILEERLNARTTLLRGDGPRAGFYDQRLFPKS